MDKDFGVITCGKCGSVSMVDIEGNIQLSEVAPAPEPKPEISALKEVTPVFLENSIQHVASEQMPVPVTESIVDAAVEAHALEVVPIENMPVETNQESSQSFHSVNEFEPNENAQPNSSFIEEIIDFGNSDLHTGPLSYNLLIEKIDSGELRSVLREVLSDPKFNLDPEQLFQSIRGGQLTIENLNPVKASLIVQRLRPFPFALSWSQHVFAS